MVNVNFRAIMALVAIVSFANQTELWGRGFEPSEAALEAKRARLYTETTKNEFQSIDNAAVLASGDLKITNNLGDSINVCQYGSRISTQVHRVAGAGGTQNAINSTVEMSLVSPTKAIAHGTSVMLPANAISKELFGLKFWVGGSKKTAQVDLFATLQKLKKSNNGSYAVTLAIRDIADSTGIIKNQRVIIDSNFTYPEGPIDTSKFFVIVMN